MIRVPKLILPSGKEQLLAKVEYLIGRHKKCDICVFGDPKISRFHATVFRENGFYYIKDGRIGEFVAGVIKPATRSGNGTFVNGTRLDQEHDWKVVLNHGDEITMGQSQFHFWFPVFRKDTDEGKETYNENPG